MKRVNLVNLTMRELSLIIISQMHAGKSQQEMVAYLRQRGWPDASAQHFIANVLSQRTAVAHADADADELQPAQSSNTSNPKMALWLVALIGLMLIGLSLIGRPPI